MREHWVNSYDNFIGGWYLDDPVIDEMIQFHRETPNKSPAKINFEINKNIKESTDCSLYDRVILDRYVNYLQKSLVMYIKKYPHCDKTKRYNIVETINIQHYFPDQAFHAWHSERTGTLSHICRHLVFMTYLNDVTDGGETEFWYQKVKIKPERGLTLIWPAEWTHTHRGITSQTQEKYIATGWYSFV